MFQYLRFSLAVVFLVNVSMPLYAEPTNHQRPEQTKSSNNNTAFSKSPTWIVKPSTYSYFPGRLNIKPGTYRLVLKALINKEGEIVKIFIHKSSGNPELDLDSIRRVRMARLTPFIVEGKPVQGFVTLPLMYRIPEQEPDSIPEYY